MNSGRRTANICYDCVKPKTEKKKITFAEEFVPAQELSNATHFVSHSWAYDFSALVAAIVRHQLRDRHENAFGEYDYGDILKKLKAVPSRERKYYWLDIFFKNQWVANSDNTALE